MAAALKWYLAALGGPQATVRVLLYSALLVTVHCINGGGIHIYYHS